MDVGRLPADQRLALAAAEGRARRYGTGNAVDRPRDEALAAIREATADPTLLGLAAGITAADPQGVLDDAVQLLVDAGADRAVAAEQELVVRARLEATGVRYHRPPHDWA